mgnify:CR=1 FL=1
MWLTFLRGVGGPAWGFSWTISICDASLKWIMQQMILKYLSMSSVKLLKVYLLYAEETSYWDSFFFLWNWQERRKKFLLKNPHSVMNQKIPYSKKNVFTTSQVLHKCVILVFYNLSERAIVYAYSKNSMHDSSCCAGDLLPGLIGISL